MSQNNTPNNAVIVSQVKGNLTKDATGPFTSKTGKVYWTATLACNNINRDPKDTWYPKVYFFADCMSIAAQLSQGDFIEITRAYLSPGEVQDLWQDKAGTFRAQSSALMVMPLRTEAGMTIPVKIIKKKEAKPQTKVNKESKSEKSQAEMFSDTINAEISSMEKEIVAEITA